MEAENDRSSVNPEFLAYYEALAALVSQSTQPVFDPLEVHCCLEDLKDAFEKVLKKLEIISQ